jgi:quercetin dioxygenase-like cupin family protein
METLDLGEATGRPGDPQYFSGPVTLRAVPEDLDPVKLIRVEFAAGARTHWHTHSGVQLLFVAEGRCRFQPWGGPVREAAAGETIHIPAGEKHWHGATPEAAMTHWAVNIDLETAWLEAVSDAQYTATSP